MSTVGLARVLFQVDGASAGLGRISDLDHPPGVISHNPEVG
jgi:hypothetical protein